MTESSPACFHCAESCPGTSPLQVTYNETSYPVCCGGCKAVFELIHASGLGRYYQFREGQAIRAGEELEGVEQSWTACDDREEFWGVAADDGQRDLLLQTEGISCSACAWLIRSRLEAMQGISRVQVDIATGFTRIIWNPERTRMSRIAGALARIGYRPHLPVSSEAERARQETRRTAMRRMGVAGLGMMQVMMYAVGLYAGEHFGISPTAQRFLEWTSLLVTIPVVFYSGRPFFSGALESLRNRRPGMDVPVALAIGVAFVASCVNFLRGSGDVYFDSVVMFIFFLSVARYIQLVQRQRNASAGTALARLMPEWAERMVDGAGERVMAVDLSPGEQVRVKPGESLPADGVVAIGTSEVDESLLTGESHPVMRQPGDEVVAGSINLRQSLIVNVTATGQDMALSHIGRMLISARTDTGVATTLADRISGHFVIVVLLLALGTFAWWARQDVGLALQATLAVLVVSCPCALSLATPAALASASRVLLERGILLTRGSALERLPQVDCVVFDKTGTLTIGRPEITGVTLNPDRPDLDETRVRATATALEAWSSHPLAEAFRQPGAEASDVREHAQGGLSGRVGEQEYRIGNAAFVGAPKELASCNESGIWLSDSEGWLSRFKLTDPLRPGSLETVRFLRDAGMELCIASGDGKGAVRQLASRLSIDDWSARQSPEEKMKRVRGLQEQGKTVLMVGDGVNDAPVLAIADVSMTVKGATELANSAADFLLTGESLKQVPATMKIAARARRVIHQNITWAIAYNLLAIPLAITGLLQPWMAALGMSASSLLVVANAARLSRRPARADRTSGLQPVTQS